MTERTLCAGGVVINKKGEVTLVISGPKEENFWGFPKGRVDVGEDTVFAAKREIEEETGIEDLVLVRPIGVYERYRAHKNRGDDTAELKVIHMFLFTSNQETLAPKDLWNPEARWIPFSKVGSVLSNAKDRDFWNNSLELIRRQK